MCSPIGLTRVSLVRASGKTFRRRVFDALGGTRDACLLGELFCRRPVLLGPAPPPRRAPRPDPPVVCPGFGLDRYGGVRALRRCGSGVFVAAFGEGGKVEFVWGAFAPLHGELQTVPPGLS